jgi:hypothetical protein
MYSLDKNLENFEVEDAGNIDWVEKNHSLICTSMNKVSVFKHLTLIRYGLLMTENAKFC